MAVTTACGGHNDNIIMVYYVGGRWWRWWWWSVVVLTAGGGSGLRECVLASSSSSWSGEMDLQYLRRIYLLEQGSTKELVFSTVSTCYPPIALMYGMVWYREVPRVAATSVTLL